MTTNNTNTRRNASHANCAHESSKIARAKCRRELRALTSYDALRRDTTRVDVIDANALIVNARAQRDNDVSRETNDVASFDALSFDALTLNAHDDDDAMIVA
jgi:hypothetical protein